jgi:hypothetical protein
MERTIIKEMVIVENACSNVDDCEVIRDLYSNISDKIRNVRAEGAW